MNKSSLMKMVLLLAILLSTAIYTHAQINQDTIPSVVTYKKIDTLDLQMHVYKPAGFSPSKQYPALLFFFGGWIGGNVRQFRKQALYLASRGMVTILVDYRVKSRHQTSPFEAVADGKSAVRYVRSHAVELNVDPNRIAAAGGSAGGHVAAATNLTKLDEPTENVTVSSRPNALILFNPVFNNGPNEFGYDRVGARYTEISPYHNIAKGAAPTLVLLGTQDELVSVKTAKAYQAKMQEVGARCDLILYPDEKHGFFNKGNALTNTLREADVFLESLGYISGKPTL
jgi:acetyl esterase